MIGGVRKMAEKFWLALAITLSLNFFFGGESSPTSARPNTEVNSSLISAIAESRS